MNVSPTSKAAEQLHPFNRPPTPPCTMGDLAAKLNQQSLRINTQLHHIPSGPLTPPSDDCVSPTEAPTQTRPTYSRVASSLLRMQRQNNSRMQCNAEHVRHLSKLVKMIEEKAQCTVSDASSRTASTSSCTTDPSEDDEGVNMDYDIPDRNIETLVGMSWRSGEQRDGCIRVTKPVRMRKRSNQNGVSKKASS